MNIRPTLFLVIAFAAALGGCARPADAPPKTNAAAAPPANVNAAPPAAAGDRSAAPPAPAPAGTAGAKDARAGGAIENRCGWFSNPTPANAWLDDRDGQWIVAVQGGFQADGDWPEFADAQWVKTNGNYGYGCACLRVEVDYKNKRFARIVAATAKPLADCRRDKTLREPSE